MGEGSEARGLYMLTLEHAAALQRLAADPEIAAALELTGPPTTAAFADVIARHLKERTKGTGATFILLRGSEALGLCTVRDMAVSHALAVILAHEHRTADNASFAARLLSDFAFENLSAERVLVRRGQGFDVMGGSQEPAEITRGQWQDARNQEALAMLGNALRPILERELDAGNEVMEARNGWPDPDGVFVRLRYAFRTRPDTMPVGVTYSEPNDPHWWRAEYVSGPPRQTLAY